MADLTDDEIVDGIARQFGVIGFDALDGDGAFDVLDDLGVDAMYVAGERLPVEVFGDRIYSLIGSGRLLNVGCGWVAVPLSWWGERIAAALGCPDRAPDIAEMLAGCGDEPGACPECHDVVHKMSCSRRGGGALTLPTRLGEGV